MEANGNGGKISPVFMQILWQLVIAGVVIYGTVRVLGERIDNIASTQKETRADAQDIRNNYIKRVEVDPRFTRIENQVDAIYRDMARLEKKVE